MALRPVLVAILGLLLAGAASAGGDVAAERLRLRETLGELAGREAWKGVERTYGQLQELGELRVEDHLMGARASLAAGDVLQAYVRLQRAIAVDPAAPPEGALAEVHRTLGEIHDQYGRVDIAVAEGRKAALVAEEPPFQAVHRACVERAADRLAEARMYKGYLPVGTYVIDGVRFVVGAEDYWKPIRVE